jgi:hypothetical protein
LHWVAAPPFCSHNGRASARHNRHLLVIAAQTDARAELRLLSAHQQLDDAASAVRPTIDVVTEKDVAGWSPAAWVSSRVIDLDFCHLHVLAQQRVAGKRTLSCLTS